MVTHYTLSICKETLMQLQNSLSRLSLTFIARNGTTSVIDTVWYGIKQPLRKQN